MHCACNPREEMKVQKSLKFASERKGVQLQPLEPPKRHHNLMNALKPYDNDLQQQELTKRLQKAKSVLKVNEILPL